MNLFRHFRTSLAILLLGAGTAHGQVFFGVGDLSDMDDTGKTTGFVVTYDATLNGGSGGYKLAAGSGGLSNIVEDTTPQLGGELDLNTYFLKATNGRGMRGTTTTGESFGLFAYDVDGGGYSQLLKLQNGDTPFIQIGPHVWPTLDGSADQVLKTDGSGNLSWTTVASSPWTDGGTTLYPTTTGDEVAIGLTTASGKLHVKPDVTTQDIVLSESIAGQTGYFFRAKDSASADKWYVNASGNTYTNTVAGINGGALNLFGGFSNRGRITLNSGTGFDNDGIAFQGSSKGNAWVMSHGGDVVHEPGAHVHSSGTSIPYEIRSTYNQTSTAGSTDFLINRTETALGSGSHYFADFQIGGSSRFQVTNAGVLYLYDGGMQEVTFGADDSGGSGFKVLRIPN